MRKNVVSLVILFISATAVSVQAQTDAKSEPGSAVSKQLNQTVDGANQASQSSTTTGDSYQSSLEGLTTYYDEDLKRLTEQNTQIKKLVDDGLASRRDLELSDQAVAEARKKIEDLRNQVASAKEVKPEAGAGAVIAIGPKGSVSWSTGSSQIDNLINYHGERNGIDPYLIYCVMNQESGFKTTAISAKGAQGLMQLMPATAARYGVKTPYDPAQSIMGGARYLKDLLEMFGGRVDLALAAYNAGEGAVMKYGNRIPPYKETREYVRNITARYGGSGLIKIPPKTPSRSL